jgi:DNA-directed RNA polymerase subunit RPC12/RpoP
MVEYICEKCGKKFDRKSSWLSHSKRKISCVAEESEITLLKKEIAELKGDMKKMNDIFKTLSVVSIKDLK